MPVAFGSGVSTTQTTNSHNRQPIALSNELANSNSLANQNQSVTMPDPARKYMPQPNSCEIPKFKNDEPSGLIRFLERMEELWRECSINDDRTKVNTIGRTLNPKLNGKP
jgi:hypothetical protein